jgi:hypothetical protein
MSCSHGTLNMVGLLFLNIGSSTDPSFVTAELRSLYAHSDLNSQYIDAYFRKHPQPTMSWIQDLGNGRWGDASGTLLKQSEHATHLATRHVWASFLRTKNYLFWIGYVEHWQACANCAERDFAKSSH